VCELMVAHGLSLEAACERVDFQLRTLREAVDEIVARKSWEEVPLAMQAALGAVSEHVQSAYLEEQRAASQIGVAASA
jgi:predicted secreted hydrolase